MKRTHVTALSVLVAAMILFAASEIMAECPNTVSKAGPFTVTFSGPDPVSCFDTVGNPATCYKYTYNVTGGGSGQITALIPVCCDKPTITYPQCTSTDPPSPLNPPSSFPCSPATANGDFGDTPSKILAAGDGDPTTGFGFGIGMGYVVRSEPNSMPTVLHLISSSPNIGIITMQFKSGKSLYYAQNIAGPACATSSPVQTEATYKAGQCVLHVAKQGKNIVSFTTDLPCYIPPSNNQGTYSDAKIVFSTGGAEETIQFINDDTITETSGSPTCYTYWYAGQWRSVCYGK